MLSIPASWRRFLFCILITAGAGSWLCSVHTGKSRLDAAWLLPPYRISLHGLPVAAQVNVKDRISLSSSAMLGILIQPLAPVRSPVFIGSYLVTDDQTLRPWPVQLAPYDQGAFILRAHPSHLPAMTNANNHLVFIVYRSKIQERAMQLLIKILPHTAALPMMTLLYGKKLSAEVQVLP